MAPELLAVNVEEGGLIPSKLDVWALGVCIWSCVELKVQFFRIKIYRGYWPEALYPPLHPLIAIRSRLKIPGLPFFG
jgi:hypothetical protein